MNAYDELLAVMESGETPQKVAFDAKTLVPWKDAIDRLREMTIYNNLHTGPNCPAIYVWSNKRVFFVSEYDGSTWLAWVPRRPVAIEPSYCGEL